MSVQQIRKICRLALIVTVIAGLASTGTVQAQGGYDPSPPTETVKLIFIHHSTGENWLTDGYGNLGSALQENNYFVSDTNYGWGPNGVGDTTDIPDWLRWFSSDETPEVMDAVYAESRENSDDYQYFDRFIADPGGENEVILFKSCFPNSDLSGNPDDQPGDYEDYTVAGAKYVYNQILSYFAARPDKLFIAITAPPLSDGTHAANARAFNNWLLHDWLVDYDGNNVKVFDFYNVLTGEDHHHQLVNGEIKHTYAVGHDTLVYPSDDDHPSAAGSQKATEEFVPLLNAWYNGWKAGAPTTPPQSEGAEPDTSDDTNESQSAAPLAGGMIADFEDSNAWEAMFDAIAETSIGCEVVSGEPYSGANALQIDFNMALDGWGACYKEYHQPQDFSAGEGINLYVRSLQTGVHFAMLLYTGNGENAQIYGAAYDTTQAAVDGWEMVQFQWSDFLLDWQEGSPPPDPSLVYQIAIAFDGYEGANNGTLWIDDIGLLGAAPVEEAAPPAEEEQPAAEDESAQPEGQGSAGGVCPFSIAMPVMVILGAVWTRRKLM
ncbi:MAG: hypothetical protein JXB38_19155 [Anaerolineales bacterium]|nr:hypothetical protein [Anaerolineales bacterium]